MMSRATTASTISPYSAPSNVERIPGIRWFARSSEAKTVLTPEDKTRIFLISIGHEGDIADGVIKAMKDSGFSGENLLVTIRNMAGRLEVDEDAGLEALVEAVKDDRNRAENRQVVTLRCESPGGGGVFEVECYEGSTIADVAKFGTAKGAEVLSELVECACDGIMACSTCHVVVHERWYDRVGPPCEDEQDMLDLAYKPSETSRLGCQVKITEDLDGLLIKIPGGAHNMMDHIPFEDAR